jgi:hypothetical protein
MELLHKKHLRKITVQQINESVNLKKKSYEVRLALVFFCLMDSRYCLCGGGLVWECFDALGGFWVCMVCLVLLFVYDVLWVE